MKIDVNELERLREAKGWTKKNLSIQASVSDFTLNRIWKGEDVREATAQCIADAFGVKLEDLLPEEEERVVEGIVEPLELAKEQPDPVQAAQDPASYTEMPDAITQTLEAVKGYGEHEYQRGRSEMCDLFLRAVREAIDRWTEVNDYENQEGER